jgi:hypothetical protein
MLVFEEIVNGLLNYSLIDFSSSTKIKFVSNILEKRYALVTSSFSN